MKKNMIERRVTIFTRSAALAALALLSVGTSSAFAATLLHSVDVNGTPSAIWAAIGPFARLS